MSGHATVLAQRAIRAAERDEDKLAAWREETLARHKRTTVDPGAWSCFRDESGQGHVMLSEGTKIFAGTQTGDTLGQPRAPYPFLMRRKRSHHWAWVITSTVPDRSRESLTSTDALS